MNAPTSPAGATTTTREAGTTATAAEPLCQTCRQPIRADEPVLACPAPNGLVWHMHASLVQCLARLTNATIESVAAALVRP